MVQGGEDFGFPLKPCEPIRIVREGLRQDLQRHIPVEPVVVGPVDHTHAPLAQFREDFIRAESTAGRQRYHPP